MDKNIEPFDHYLIRIVEHYRDMEFCSVIAVRMVADLTPDQQREAIEEYVSGWRDSCEEVEQIDDKPKWTGPSGVVVELKAYQVISESTWFLMRETSAVHTACI